MTLRNLARRAVLKSVAALRLNGLALAGTQSHSRIVVVEMHETLRAHAAQLREQLDWVANHFTLITPACFARSIETKAPAWSGPKPAVLFTFDDGRESNYQVAAPLLESYGARGIFFVVPAFIGLKGSAARDFYYSKIDIRNIAPTEDQPEEIWKPMTPAQLADLTDRGHWVGNLTLSHTDLAGLSAASLEREIQSSSQQIARRTGQPVDAFAWPYSWNAIDRQAWEAVRSGHRFCFSPCPGTVQPATGSPFLLWRKEVESYYPAAEYQFMYSGFVDLLWAGKRGQLKRLLSGAS